FEKKRTAPTTKNTPFSNEILEKFENFYANFCDIAPIMILPLGVSHFTRGEYIYRLDETADEIFRLYDALKNFPRLGLIIYGDAFTLARAYSDDFSVSIEEKLISGYARAISHEKFFSTLIKNNSAEKTKFFRSKFRGMVWQDRIYIPVETLENEMKLSSRQTISVDGKIFVESRRINKKIFLCDENRIIFLEDTP
ncbi:MAG: hypothetical protein FWD19_02680, partial [Defluviitaleaceae bacterium]|nr:hypothetical protein [Defluviitaleaceae bacterium]